MRAFSKRMPVKGRVAALFVVALLVGSQGAQKASVGGRPPPRQLAQRPVKCPLPGVVFGLNLTKLPTGWTTFYEEPYSDATTLEDIRLGDQTSPPHDFECILLGAKLASASALHVAAFGDREKFETASHFWDNGVFWYTVDGQSTGFAGNNDISLEPADKAPFDAARRLSWHLGNGRGGYRAGRHESLDRDTTWHKVVMHGPQGAFCEESVCGDDEVLKAQDLPPYCMGKSCTQPECCAKRASCSALVCELRFTRKPQAPELCAGDVCDPKECCVEAPECTVHDCGAGYILKPIGLPQYGCSKYRCTVEECCEVAPKCPAWACADGYVLQTPVPNCASAACPSGECCVRAGECVPGLCPAGLEPRSGPRMPEYCKREVCTVAECCEMSPPTVHVSGGRLTDLDLDLGALGGNVTWVPPAPDGTVTRFAVYLETPEPAEPASLAFQGNVSWGTNTLALPVGTAAPAWLLVYACNAAGPQEQPARFALRDVALAPSGLSFTDLDLDRKEIGGLLQWADPLAGFADAEAAVCRSGVALGVRGGGGGEDAAFFLDGQRLLQATAADGVSVAVLGADLRAVVQRGLFHTAESDDDAKALERFLEALPGGAVLLLAAAGRAAAHLGAGARAAIAGYGARELGDLGLSDSYALIGVKGGEALSESLAGAVTGLPAFAAFACPVAHLSVHLEGLGTPARRAVLGTVPVGINHLAIPEGTAMPQPGLSLAVRAASAIAEQERPGLAAVKDNAATVSGASFSPDDPSAAEVVAGTLTWTAVPDEAPITAYRVYLAGDGPAGERSQVGADVDTTWRTEYGARVPAGTPRGNFSRLLVYAVSQLAEQSAPSAEVPLGSASTAVLTVAVVSTVSAVGVARVASVAQAAAVTSNAMMQKTDMQSLERCATKMEAAEVDKTPILGTYTSSHGDTITIAEGGEPPYLRSLFSPLTCGLLHYQHPCISVQQTGSRTKTKLYRHRACEYSWDNAHYVLRKLSNSIISIRPSNGEALLLHRSPPSCRRCLEGPTRIAIRMYGPLLVLIVISAIVVGMQHWAAGVVLLGTTFVCIVVVFTVSHTACLQRAVVAIATAPPASIRERFWNLVGFFVGLFPCVPAFMSGTTVGWVTGALAVVGALVKLMDAAVLAGLLEGVGGAVLAAFCLIQNYWLEEADVGGAADSWLMASFLSAALIAVKGIDGYVADLWVLYLDTPVPSDELLAKAEATEAETELGLSQAVALEAFALGAVPVHMGERLVGALRRAAAQLLRRARRVTRKVFQELHSQDSGWRRVSASLGRELGRAIDAAGGDLGLSSLAQVGGIDELALASGMGALGGHYLVDHVLRREVGPGLRMLEESLDALLNGTLTATIIAKGKESAMVMQTELRKIQKHINALERCLGLHANAGHRVHVEVLGVHVSRVALVGEEVKRELADGGRLSTADKALVEKRLAEVRELAGRAAVTLGALAVDAPNGYDDAVPRARTAISSLIGALVAAGQHLRADEAEGSSGGADRSEALLGALERLLAATGGLAALQRRLASLVPALGEVVAQHQAEAEADLRWCAGRLAEPTRDEAVEALGAARSAIGLAAAVTQELQAAAEAAGKAVGLLETARHEGLKVLDEVAEAHRGLTRLTVQDVTSLQEKAVRFATGTPLQALTLLQDLASETLADAFKALGRELDSLQSCEPEAHPDDDAPTDGALQIFPKQRASAAKPRPSAYLRRSNASAVAAWSDIPGSVPHTGGGGRRSGGRRSAAV